MTEVLKQKPKSPKQFTLSPEARLKMAINDFFNHPEGTIYIKPITEENHRINWYNNGRITYSRFIKIQETKDGIIITDLTK